MCRQKEWARAPRAAPAHSHTTYQISNWRRTMTMLRRLAVVVSIVLCASMAFAAVAIAAGATKGSGPGPLAPGDYVTTVIRADAVFGQQGPPGPPGPKGGPGPSTDPQISIFAVKDFESFQPQENRDQTGTTSNTTTLFVQLSNT